jgi:hypothetical protein
VWVVDASCSRDNNLHLYTAGLQAMQAHSVLTASCMGLHTCVPPLY